MQLAMLPAMPVMKGGAQKGDDGDDGCFNCGSPLHWARDCPKGKSKGKGKGFSNPKGFSKGGQKGFGKGKGKKGFQNDGASYRNDGYFRRW